MTRLRRLTLTICAFHLGFSLGCLSGVNARVLVLGLVVAFSVIVAFGYMTAVSAQGKGDPPAGSAAEPTPTPTPEPTSVPDGKGKDDEDEGEKGSGSSPSGARGASQCSVTSMGTISDSASRTGSYASDCSSVNRSGRYARFFSFTLSQDADVRIDLDSTGSPAVDTYMFLLSGSGTSGSEVESDDDGGSGTNSRIERRLTAGTYTVEATTYSSSTTGSFSVSVSVLEPCVSALGNVTGTVTRSGTWAQGCSSQNRSGSYARYFSFNVVEQGEVRIDLSSSGSTSVDTYLYLLSGSGKTGSVLESDDDGGSGTNSRITRNLSPGAYTLEATTYSSGDTGSFSLSFTGLTLSCETSLGTISGTNTRLGTWSSGCSSTNRSGSYARFYTFTLNGSAEVAVSLDSTDSPQVDTYLYLFSGSGTSGSVLGSDDDGGSGRNSYLSKQLAAGTYTVEATTFSSSTTGAFQVSMVVSGSSPSGCSITSLGTIATGDRDSRLGSWGSDCASQNRGGKYARFYSFQVSGTSDVRIDLDSADNPEVDTYLYLISGSSVSGTVLERDDDGGNGRNSRITRQLSAGTYTLEATTFGSARTGRFTVAVEVSKPAASANLNSVYLGQSVTLSATAPSSQGSVSTYQWQQWTDSSWSNYGSASATSTRPVGFSTAGTRVFRAVVSYSSGSTGSSSPVAVEWVSAAKVSYSPESPALNASVTLTVGGTSGPAGATYQWQKVGSTGGWTNLGTASSARSYSVSSSSQGTQQFRVVVSYTAGGSAFTDTSDAVYVTWDESGLLGSLMSSLDTNVFGGSTGASGGASRSASTRPNTTFDAAERLFLPCVNRRTGRSGDDAFGSFFGVLAEYDGAVATAVDTCEDPQSDATTMFTSYSQAVDAELTRLSSSNALYGDYLSSPRGSVLSEGLASKARLKLTGTVMAAAPSGSSSSSGSDGASGSNGGGGSVPQTGARCVPSTAPSTLQGKLNVLNCLVFKTPHQFWADVTDEDRRTIDAGEWLGSGNWECDTVPEGPLPACRKHDVAYGSLQRFSGSDSTELLDRSWNPRNKALADAKFWADIDRYGCWGGEEDEAILCLGGNWAAAWLHFKGVTDFNDKGWPVTTQDLDHARAHRDGNSQSVNTEPSTHKFVDCSGLVPRLGGVSVRRDSAGDFHATWTYQSGCVSLITVDEIEMELIVHFEGLGFPAKGTQKLDGVATTTARFPASSFYRDHTAVAVEVKVAIKPDNREYGGKAYEQDILLFLQPQLQ